MFNEFIEGCHNFNLLHVEWFHANLLSRLFREKWAKLMRSVLMCFRLYVVRKMTQRDAIAQDNGHMTLLRR